MGGTTSKPMNADSEQKTNNDKTKTGSSSTAVILQNNNQSTSSSSPSTVSNDSKETLTQLPEEILMDEIVTITTLYKDLVQLSFKYDGRYHNEYLFKQIYSSLEERILFLAQYAGPFSQFESLIRQYAAEYYKDKKAKKDNILIDKVYIFGERQGKLPQLIVSGLDQTIRNEQGKEIDTGMAEFLMKLIGELFPDRYDDAIDQARKAVFLESNEQKSKRESANLAFMEGVVNAFIEKDKTAKENVIKDLEEYVLGTKKNASNEKGYLTNNLYYLNLLHLVYCALALSTRKGRELKDKWFGDVADQFCFKVIGAVLQSKLPSRIQQILEGGFYHLFYKNKVVARDLDMDSWALLMPGSDDLLESSFYYDMFAMRRPHDEARPTFRQTFFFQTLLQQLHLPPEYGSPKPQSNPKPSNNLIP